MASLGELSIAISNMVCARSYLGGFSQAPKGIKQLGNVSISLGLTPVLPRVLDNISQVSVCCPRNSEVFHQC